MGDYRQVPRLDIYLAVLFAIVSYFILIQNDEHIFPSDAQWAIHLYSSIVYEGNTDLDEFRPQLEDRNFHSARVYNETAYSYFPIGTPIFLTPVLFVLEKGFVDFEGENLNEYLQTSFGKDSVNLKLHLLSASVAVALTGSFLYLIGLYYVPRGYALLLAFVFIFGSTAYSTASRALWQHGPSILTLAVSLWLLVRAEHGKKGLALAGFMLAWAYLIRPSNSVPIALITAYIFFYHRSYFIKFILCSLPLAILFFAYNLNIYDQWLHPYYAASRLGITPTFYEALLGNLVSPARGLFVYSSFLLLLIPMIWMGIAKRKFEPLDWILLAIVTLHWIAISMFAHWWGGYSYGPRLFTDMLPVLFLLFVRNFLHVVPEFDRTSIPSKVMNGLLIGLSAVSVTIHHVGVVNQAGWSWNSLPTSIDQFPERLWDWSDIQFLRPLKDPNRIGLAVIGNQPEEGLTKLELQLGNVGSSDKYWDIYVIEGVTLYPDFYFDNKLDDSKNLIARYNFPITSNTSHPISLTFPHELMKDSDFALRVDMLEEDGQVINSGVIPLDQLIPLGSFEQAGRANNLKLLYGQGWYPREFAGEFEYRWTKSPATIFLYSETDQTKELELVFGEMFDPAAENGKGNTGKMTVTTESGPALEFEVQNGVPLVTTVDLVEGYNQIEIKLETGNFSPADFNAGDSDRRLLSFITNKVELR